jgi:hypothetical protein
MMLQQPISLPAVDVAFHPSLDKFDQTKSTELLGMNQFYKTAQLVLLYKVRQLGPVAHSEVLSNFSNLTLSIFR